MIAPPASRISVFNVALATLFGGGLCLQLRSVLNSDQAWLIHGTEVFLSGGTLYRDVLETNPPLIFYLTVPPVWFARHFDLFTINVFIIYTFALIAVCMILVWVLLSHEVKASRHFRQVFLLAVAVALIVMPADRFGEREHLMVVLSLPYVLLLVMRARHLAAGRVLSFTIGVLAALGFSLKPHFLLVPAGIVFYLAIQVNSIRRCIRPETIALASAGLLYFASIFVFTPDYLTTIVPFAVEVYDRAYRSPLSLVLARPESILMPVILWAHVLTRRHQTVPELGDLLAIAAVGFFAAYLIQMKGWGYQIYPLDAALFLLLTSVFLQTLRQVAISSPSRHLRAALGGLLAVLTVGAGWQCARQDIRTNVKVMNDLAPFVRALPRGSFIDVFSTSLAYAFPLVNYHHLGWSSRFDTFWLLPGLISQPNRSRGIEQFLRDTVVEDLIKNPPLLIFVECASKKFYSVNFDFDFIEYFSTDSRFRAIWAGYREIARVDDFQIFLRSARAGLE